MKHRWPSLFGTVPGFGPVAWVETGPVGSDDSGPACSALSLLGCVSDAWRDAVHIGGWSDRWDTDRDDRAFTFVNNDYIVTVGAFRWGAEQDRGITSRRHAR